MRRDSWGRKADSEWRRYEVSALIKAGALEIGDGYRAKNDELATSGLPFARAGNIKDGFQFADADRFPEENLERIGNKISESDDVVFTSKGTVGRFAFVREDTPRFVYSPQLCFWRSRDHELIDPRFLFYWMSGREFFIQFKGVAGQTDMADYVSLRDQRSMHLTLPPLPEQRAIAHILGTLDDKIELNRRMNETLEEMARALFKSWFIDFDPVHAKAALRNHTPNHSPLDWTVERARAYLDRMDPSIAALFPDRFVDSELGQISAGWQVSEISQITDVIDCLHSKKPERRVQGRPLLQLWNIRDDGLLDMADTYLIDDPDYEQWTSRMEAVAGDCVITNVGRVGAVAQVPIGLKTALGRNMTGIRCKESSVFPTFLIECLLSQAMRNEISLNMDTGTILEALNVRNIPKLRFVLGTNRVLSSFEQRVRPLRARMEKNISESRTLAALRDTLLPKLMSGELRVKSQKQHD